MRFCPRCGTGLSQAQEQGPPPQQAWQQPVPMPYQYPVMPVPYPVAYYPWSGGRIAAVSGGILVIIDAVMAMLLGIGLATWDLIPGTYLVVASSVAIAGAVSVFLAWFPYLGVAGSVMLIIGGGGIMAYRETEPIIIGIVGATLAAISLVLMIVGWKDLMQRAELRRRMRTPLQTMEMAPGAYPPSEYGRGPGGP